MYPLRASPLLLPAVLAAALTNVTSAAAPSRDLEEQKTETELQLHMYTPLCRGTEATCGWPAGESMDIAVQLMIEYINHGGYLHGNRTLKLELFDTACADDKGRDEAARLLLLPEDEKPFAVIGCGCTGCTTSAQPLLNLARLPLVSHGASSADLSDRQKFPNFFRVNTPDHEGLRALLVMFKELQWTSFAQIYDTAYGAALAEFVSGIADDFGMTNVFAGNGIAEMREATPDDARPLVEALVLARTRAMLYMGQDTSLWYLACSMYEKSIKGMIVAHMGWYQDDWWLAQPSPAPCTPSQMNTAVDQWIAARVPKFTDLEAQVECFPEGVKLRTFVEEYESRRAAAGLASIAQTGAAADVVCFLSRIFNDLLDMGYTATEVHNMNETTYMEYASLAQNMQMMGTSGPIKFPSDPTAWGSGDRTNVFWVDQLQDGVNVRIAKVDGESVVFEPGSLMAFFGNYTLMNPPPAFFPQCAAGVYNYTVERCQDCPDGSDFIAQMSTCFCSPGFFAKGSQCSPCAEGSYSDVSGSAQCKLCNSGKFASLRGQTSCELCPLNEFMSTTGAAICELCGRRRITLERGADSEDLCICAEETYMENTTSKCETCPEGLICEAGLNPPQQDLGFWAEIVQDKHTVWRCRDQYECSGGAIGECPSGRIGRCCNDCEAGYRPLEDGSCKPCESWDVVPAVVVCLVIFAVAVGLLALVRVDTHKENLELIGINIMATQLFMVLQMLTAFSQIQVRWVEPAKLLLEQLKLVSLDLDFVNGNCWLPSADPVSKFLVQLFAFPVWTACVMVAWGVSQFTRKPMAFIDIFCLLGTVLFMVFITLTLTVLLPFQCQNNPSGMTSMAAHPGLICFESSKHVQLVVMAVLGFLAYPAVCLTWATWATKQYPTWVSSGHGFRQVRKYRFLFGRFKPESYYFGLWMLFRNALIALLPVVLVSLEAAQIVVLCVILLLSSLFVAYATPWRTSLANKADVLMLFCMVVLLTGMAMLVQVTEETELTFGWLLSVLMMLPLALGLASIGVGIWRNVTRKGRYDIFLSHHKAGAGVLARFIKLEMAIIGVTNVFLDVDHLEDLDSLFNIVRRQTRNMVILLSSETLKRMWCAGEIVTAHRNRVHTVPVFCDGFEHLDGAELSGIVEVWTSTEMQALSTVGISWDMTKSAYTWLQELPSVELRRFCTEDEHAKSLQSIMKACLRSKATLLPKAPESAKPRVLVTGAISDPEALAACQVFKVLLQQALHTETAVVRTPSDIEDAAGSAVFFTVLFSRNLLLDPHFAEVLLAANEVTEGGGAQMPGSPTGAGGAHAAPGKPGSGLTFVTVMSDTGFEFPTVSFYETLRQKGLGSCDIESLIRAYQSLVRVLALPFSPLGSLNLLTNEISEICRRRYGILNSSSKSPPSAMSKVFNRRTSDPNAASNGDFREKLAFMAEPEDVSRETKSPSPRSMPVRHKTAPMRTATSI